MNVHPLRTLAALWMLGFGLAAHAAPDRPLFLHTPPAQVRPGEPLVVQGAFANLGRTRFSSVQLRFRGPGAPYETVRLEPILNEQWRAIIPGNRITAPGIEYCVEGIAGDGTRMALFMTEARPARVLVVANAVRPPPPPPEPPRPTPVATPTPPAPRPVEPERTPPPRVAELDRGVPPPTQRNTPPPEPEPRATAPRPVEPAPRSVEPRAENPEPEPRATAPRPAEPLPRAEPASEPRPSAPRPSSAPRSELEEDLALYSAEDRAVALVRDGKVEGLPPGTTVIHQREMRTLAIHTVFDALSLVPGLSISRDVAGFHRTAVRGLRSDAEVLFLYDGHVLNDFYDGRALANLPVENLDRIEITRGPGGASGPPGAFLAVINIVPLREEGISAVVTGGGFRTDPSTPSSTCACAADGHLSALKTLGGVKLFLDADVLGQQGGRRVVDKDLLDSDTLAQGYREDPLDPAGLTRDDRRLINVGAGLSWERDGGGKLAAQFRFMDEQRSALIGLFDTLGNDSRLAWRALLADVTYDQPLGAGITLHGRLFFDDQTTERNYQLSPGATTGPSGVAIPGFSTGPGEVFPEGVREAFNVGARTFGLDLRAAFAFSDTNQFTTGLLAQLQSVVRYEHLTNFTVAADGSMHRVAPPSGSEMALVNQVGLHALPAGVQDRTTLAFFAQDTWRFLPPFTLTVGGRAEAISVPLGSTGAASEFLFNLSPRVALSYAVSPSLAFHFSYARTLRPPTPQEYAEEVVDTELTKGRFHGALGLTPPVIDALEIGGELVQVTNESRVRIRGVAFYENLSGPILPVDTSGDQIALQNRLGVRVVGGEAEARLDLSQRANAWINASIFRAWDLETLPGFWLLTDTPQGRMNMGISMPLGDFLNFDVTLETGAERRNDSRSALEATRRFRLPAYHLVTVQLRTETLFEHFEAALAGRNLFEHDLRDDPMRPDRMPGAIPREGLSGFLTVRATY